MSAEKERNKNHDLNLIVRIFSTDVPGTKSSVVGLSEIKGIDEVFSHAVLKVSSIPSDKLIGELTKEEVNRIEEVIESPVENGIPSYLLNRRKDPEEYEDMHIVGPDVELKKDFDIRRMRRIRSYKGLRHSWGLKVRGQKLKSYRKGEAAVAGIKRKTLK